METFLVKSYVYLSIPDDWRSTYSTEVHVEVHAEVVSDRQPTWFAIKELSDAGTVVQDIVQIASYVESDLSLEETCVRNGE